MSSVVLWESVLQSHNLYPSEVMKKVVLSVVLLMAPTGASYERAKSEVTRLLLNDIAGSIEQFRLMHNRLPTQLRELTECSSDLKNCVPLREKDSLVDAWGYEIRYEVAGGTYRLTSLGHDQKFGGADEQEDLVRTGP